MSLVGTLMPPELLNNLRWLLRDLGKSRVMQILGKYYEPLLPITPPAMTDLGRLLSLRSYRTEIISPLFFMTVTDFDGGCPNLGCLVHAGQKLKTTDCSFYYPFLLYVFYFFFIYSGF